MRAWLMVLYSVAAYGFFLVTFACTAAFVGGFGFVKNIESGPVTTVAHAIAVDLMLLAVFVVQHSVMARRGFKRWWTRIVPEPIERSTFVLAATGALAFLIWQWRPIPDPVIWHASSAFLVMLLWALFASGWAVALVSTFLIDHFELFGLRQAFAVATGRTVPPAEFRTPFLYRMVRHPLYLGLLIAFWATPHMSAGHLLFSLGTTAYIFLGMFFEERDLVAQFGARYHAYRDRVAMIVPFMGKQSARE
jgi:protein-S-isoprenylcysteine O-methyltransferase Ste14